MEVVQVVVVMMRGEEVVTDARLLYLKPRHKIGLPTIPERHQ